MIELFCLSVINEIMIGKLFLCLGAFVLTGIASWLALWCANIFNYMLSLPFSIVDIIVENSNDFIRFIYFAITTGIAYFFCYMICFEVVYGGVCNINDDYEWLDSLVLIILAICIIFVCDPRLHSNLSPALVDLINYCKEEYNYNILGVVSWDNLDFSGDKIPAVQYKVFDIAVALAALFKVFIRKI